MTEDQSSKDRSAKAVVPSAVAPSTIEDQIRAQFGIHPDDSIIEVLRRRLTVAQSAITRRSILEEAAQICDKRAAYKGRDDEADNEAQLCAALIRDYSAATDSGISKPPNA